MHSKNYLPVCLAFLAFFLGSSAISFAQIPGKVSIINIRGDVTALDANGDKATVKNGKQIAQGWTIMTGADGSAFLMLSNGSLVKLGKDTKMKIDEFTQSPSPAVAGIMEKGVSRTLFNLSIGEINGSVNKLNVNSLYQIKTPVGVAGIRGTLYHIVVRKDPSTNSYIATFDVGTGNVGINIGTQAGPILGASESLTIMADVNMETGAVTVNNQQIGQISPADLQILNNLPKPPPPEEPPTGETAPPPPPTLPPKIIPDTKDPIIISPSES